MEDEKPASQRTDLEDDLGPKHSEEEPSESLTRRLEALASLGQLTATVSHEFNNILTAILGWAQLALRDPQNPRTVETALSTIEANARRARRVIRDLLDSVQHDEDRAPASVTDIVQDALRLLAWELHNAGVRVQRDFGVVPDLSLDRGRIQQVVVNLLLNAIQAMPVGGDLSVRVRCVPSGVEVQVTDSGTGVDAELADRVFDPFFSTKRAAEGPSGSGLGLSISRQIAREHGGDIRLTAAPGRGAVFTLFLPTAQHSVTPAVAAPAVEADRPLPIRVLVIDDEADIRELLTTALELKGATVVSAADPASGFDELRQTDFELVLLDYTLPGTSGPEILNRMRELRPGIPVYFISGRSGEVALGSAPTGWIRKPFDLDEIYREIARSVAT